MPHGIGTYITNAIKDNNKPDNYKLMNFTKEKEIIGKFNKGNIEKEKLELSDIFNSIEI